MNALREILMRVFTTRAAWPILIAIALLSAVSLSAINLSAGGLAERQRLWLAISGGVIILALLPHFHFLGRIAYVLFALAILLLIGVLFAPDTTNTNTHRWFNLFRDVQLQPSELAKIAFVMALAWYLRYRKNLRTVSGLVIPFALAIVPFALIIIEPDLGTAILFPLVLYAMLVAAGARLRHLVVIALIAIFSMPGAYPFLKPYQQERIRSLFFQIMGNEDPAYINGPGHQAYQSMIAIGSGGATGQGNDAAQHLHSSGFYASSTDFIFAVIGAQWGYMGCLLVILMYLAFYLASIEIAASTRDNFGRLLVVGLASMILFQAMINMYMTVGMGPVTGIALPFVSYGGSSLMASMLAAGLLLNVSVRRNFHSAAN